MKIQKINRDNANDSEVTVVEIIKNGEKVKEDNTTVIEVETTKAIIEQYPDCSGYFYSDVKVDDVVEIGYNYAIISDVELEEKEWLNFLKKSRKKTEVKIESSNQHTKWKILVTFLSGQHSSQLFLILTNGLKLIQHFSKTA